MGLLLNSTRAAAEDDPDHAVVVASTATAGDKTEVDAASNAKGPAVPAKVSSGAAVALPASPGATPGAASADGPVQAALQEYRRATTEWEQRARSQYAGLGILHQFHGTLFEYFRNDALDAVPHEIRQGGEQKAALRRNQFGFNLTGPLPFGPPENRSTHFSISYEGTRESIARAFLGTVPTVQERAANFSDLVDASGQPVAIYDPATTRPNPNYNPSQPVSVTNLQYLRDPFPGNVIPQQRIDPVAQAAINFYPLPNAHIGPFLTNNFFAAAVERTTPNGVVLHLDHTVNQQHEIDLRATNSVDLNQSPSVFANAASPGASTARFLARHVELSERWKMSDKTTNSFSADWGVDQTDATDESGQNLPARVGLTGVDGQAFPQFSFASPYTALGKDNPDTREHYRTFGLSDYVSHRQGDHSIDLGWQYRLDQLHSYEAAAPSGSFIFSGQQTSLPGIVDTGNAVAQFLLGQVSSAQQSVVPGVGDFHISNAAVDLQDRYPVVPGFDWTVGLSVAVTTPRSEEHGRQSAADFATVDPATLHPGAMVFTDRPGLDGGLQPVRTVLEPHVAFALNPSRHSKMVIRGSYRLYSGQYPLLGENFATMGFNLYPQFTSPNDLLQPAFLLRNGVPPTSAPPDLSPSVGDGQIVPYLDPNGLLPSYQEWSFGVERELTPALSLRLRYHGQLTTHEFVWSAVDLNGLTPGDLRYGDQLYDLNFNQSLRPYPQFQGISLGGAYPFGTASYEGVHVILEQRFARGLMFQANYEFGKGLDNYSGQAPQDNSDLRLEKSITSWDRTQALTLNYTYQLPLGGENKWLHLPHTSWLLSGWSLSGFATLDSGFPLQLTPMFNHTGGVADSLRVDAVSGINEAVGNPSADIWFNPAAFIQPADFTLGDVSRTSPTLRAPGRRLLDVSLNRDTMLSENRSMQFYIEAFDAFNHANLNTPDTVIGSESTPNLHAGKITGSTGGRVVELGLRFAF